MKSILDSEQDKKKNLALSQFVQGDPAFSKCMKKAATEDS